MHTQENENRGIRPREYMSYNNKLYGFRSVYFQIFHGTALDIAENRKFIVVLLT
jgi:hypothetical protein